MAGFVARWLSDVVRIGLSLAFALAAMQVPAVAHGYATALLQIAQDARRDIEQRKASARQYYRAAGEGDEAVIEALRAVEPSNAQALAASVERARALRAAHDRIEAAPPLLRPVTALLDAGWRGGTASADLIRPATRRASAAAGLVLDREDFGFPTPEEIDLAIERGRIR